jgi:small subunit ribosomal protein S3
MSQKVHPKIFRIPTTRGWDSNWFAKKDYADLLEEDHKIRTFLEKKLKDAAVDHVAIERNTQNITVTIHSAKPGFIIGRSGAGIEDLKKKLKWQFFRGRRVNLNLNVQEVPKPSLSASIIGQQIRDDLEKRLPFRRSMKQTIERVMKGGAKGVKIALAGRLNGADIARTEQLSQGCIPLHNLRADIDFARVRAWTTYGTIGIKIWINRGEVFEKKTDK